LEEEIPDYFEGGGGVENENRLAWNGNFSFPSTPSSIETTNRWVVRKRASAEEEIEQRRLLVGWLSREEKEVGGGWQWLSGAVASAIFAPTLTRRVGLGRNEKLRLTEGKDGDF
jgi:hypothetical protein